MVARCCVWNIAAGLRWQLQADGTSIVTLAIGGDVNQDAVIVGAGNADGARVRLPMVNNIKCSWAKSHSQSVENARDGLVFVELCVNGARSAT